MADVVLGMQWGDEGKGKVISALPSDWVVRVNGGPNAGHTVDGTKVHQVPPGIARPETKLVISAGSVVDPAKLVVEIDRLEAEGYQIKHRLFVDVRAHVISEWHIREDRIRETSRGDKAIGTTLTGNGPVHAEKYLRTGKQIQDSDWETVLQDEGILLARTDELLRSASNADEKIVLMVAHGAMLDIDYGTYPYVTSSHVSVNGALAAAGLSPWSLQRVIGVAKVYTTRVAPGLMRGEVSEEIAEKIREVGNEYGTTTGRPRRIGWLDLGQLHDVAQRNGVTELYLTKADVLLAAGVQPHVIRAAWGESYVPEPVPSWQEVSFNDANMRRFVSMLRPYSAMVTALGTGPDPQDIVRR